MMVNPGTGTGVGGTTESPPPSKDTVARLARAYMATYHGPHGDAPGADAAITAPVDRASLGTLVSPAMVEAQYRLGRRRSFGDTRVAVYADDDPAGFGAALQIVTDNAAMLMDSVTVLLHRLGVAYTAIMNPAAWAERLTTAYRSGGRCAIRRWHRRGMDPRAARRFGRPQGGG